MPKFPFAEHYRLKRDIATRSPTEAIEPRVDPALADELPDDRLVARNDCHTVVVPLPKFVYPSIEYGGTQFSVIMRAYHNQTLDDIATSLEAVESMLDPQCGPELCCYGVLVGLCQVISNTPERFLTDLQNGDAIAGLLAQSDSAGPAGSPTSHVIGACVWPTSYGTFFLVARHGDPDGYSVRYGLLQHGMPLDTTPITQFFDAITDNPPTHIQPWPLRQLSLSGDGLTPLRRLEPIEDAVVTPESNPAMQLTHCGGNPVYGVPADDIGIESGDPELDIYRSSLQSISTLGYDPVSNREFDTHALDSIHVLDTPLSGLCIATATLTREQ